MMGKKKVSGKAEGYRPGTEEKKLVALIDAFRTGVCGLDIHKLEGEGMTIEMTEKRHRDHIHQNPLGTLVPEIIMCDSGALEIYVRIKYQGRPPL
jgi:hypothetical protein